MPLKKLKVPTRFPSGEKIPMKLQKQLRKELIKVRKQRKTKK